MALSPAPAGLSAAGWATAALGVWMAIWWATEAIPLFATALLPLVLLPLLGISNLKAAAVPFANPIVFLLFGGFLIALAVERSPRRLSHPPARRQPAFESDRRRDAGDRRAQHVDQQHGDDGDDAADRDLPHRRRITPRQRPRTRRGQLRRRLDFDYVKAR